MNSFIRHILFFILFSAGTLLTGILGYIKISGIDISFIPPPRIANNISFNDKMVFANNKTADHIAIGSSMTLCNLHSSTIIKMLGSNSYLNMAAWGLSIEDSYVLLKKYAENKMPKTVIISSNIVDFCMKQVFFEIDEISKILSCRFPQIFYLKYPEIRYYLSNSDYYKKIKSSDKIYDSLVYDEYGAVCYADNLDEFDNVKWTDTWADDKLDRINYAYLDSISNFTRRNNIKFIFLQSPFREGLLDIVDTDSLNKHAFQVASILNKYDHPFINSMERTWADSLYIDGTHFTTTGAKLYTDYCIGKVKNNISTYIKTGN